ncbi:MAG: HD domain-containing protein [Clostridiaceae bacterium]|nr:HD domain-containing protein [Clostridiaceae bacterium]
MEEYTNKIMGLEQIPFDLRKTVSAEMVHGIEVSNMAVLIAKELGEEKAFCEQIEVAGVLHDIGKLKLIKYLYAEDGLLVEQMKYVRQHTAQSYEIILDAGYGMELARVVYDHHENYDGSGYPDGLRGENIPWMARILRVCDVFIALITDRSYREAFDPKSALEIMIHEVQDYDMRVFLAFQRVVHHHAFCSALDGFQQIHSERQSQALEVFEKELMLLAE